MMKSRKLPLLVLAMVMALGTLSMGSSNQAHGGTYVHGYYGHSGTYRTNYATGPYRTHYQGGGYVRWQPRVYKQHHSGGRVRWWQRGGYRYRRAAY